MATALEERTAGSRPEGLAAAPAPSRRGGADPDRPRRRVGPAGHVLVVAGVCFLLWALLAAPALKRALGLDRVQSLADSALGRRRGSVAEPFGRKGPGLSGGIPSGRGAGGASAPSASGAMRGTGPVGAGSVGGTSVPPTRATVSPPVMDDRLRVLLVGDSIGEDLGIGLGRLLDSKGTFLTRVDARLSTGLARPDYFDWPKQEDADIRSFHPDVVVAMFGGNDNQGLVVAREGYRFGSPDWTEVYAGRVAGIISEAASRGAAVVWVGMPPMKDQSFSGQMRTLNEVFRLEAARHAAVVYVDSWSLFAGPRGGYAPYLPDGSDREQMVRTSDGVHLTVAGGIRLAAAVFDAMRTLWDRPPAPPTPSPSPAPISSVPGAPAAGPVPDVQPTRMGR